MGEFLKVMRVVETSEGGGYMVESTRAVIDEGGAYADWRQGPLLFRVLGTNAAIYPDLAFGAVSFFSSNLGMCNEEAGEMER